MSYFIPIAQALLQFSGQRKQAKAEREAQRMKRTNAIRTMNYAFQNLETNRQDAFEGAVGELEKINYNARGLRGAVNASISEEIGEGRTARALSRSVHGEQLRAEGSVKDNYARQSNEIDLNKEQQLIQTKSYIQGLALPKVPGWKELALGLGTAYIGQKNHNDMIEMYKNARGVDMDYNYSGVLVQKHKAGRGDY